MQEYLIKWNVIHQWFLKTPLEPVNGVITLPETPGLGHGPRRREDRGAAPVVLDADPLVLST